LWSTAALAEVVFSQKVDRTEVGLQDTFRLTISVGGVSGAQLTPGESDDFEVLSRSQSTQMALGPSGFTSTETFSYVMRANAVGTFTIPPAQLKLRDGKVLKTEPIRIVAKKGKLYSGPSTTQDRFGGFPGFPGLPGPGDDADLMMPGAKPQSQSDLVLKAVVDRTEVFVGQQVSYSLYLLSRADVSSVEHTLPKLEGFWSEDIESPNELRGERKVVDGVPYVAYLLRRRALFPMRPGELMIDAAEADVVTGYVFAGRRLHRASQALNIKVKPLPQKGPAGVSASQVGTWKLSTEVSSTQVQLGQPVTVRVVLEGRGNLRNVSAPKLEGPPQLKVYDPTVSEKLQLADGKFGGRKVYEYLVMPQQSGAFTLPGLSMPYFDPETGKYLMASTEAIALAVTPGAAGNATVDGAASQGGTNVLTAGTLRPIRVQSRFEQAGPPLWRRPVYWSVLAAPLVLWAAAGCVAAWKRRARRDEAEVLRRQRERGVAQRLEHAEKLAKERDAKAFYGEVERALLESLELQLGESVLGLTREALDARMRQGRIPEIRRRKLLGVLEACDSGRFAPGGGMGSARRVLDEARHALEGSVSK
jgi:hypothetical protein